MSNMVNVKSLFCDFFAANDHKVIPSAPLVPEDDPSLLFINAGMAPLKDYFIGYKHAPYKNLVSCQKCIRAGGKHNDLDQVGYTKRHHTFFEMCGNFSFGGYQHKKAIDLAWTFLTEVLKISSSKLWVTVHPEDEISNQIWNSIVSKNRIIPLVENKWSMGNDGPCGMCTEIFYDHGDHLPGTIEGGDRFVEIWNIVLMTHQMNNGMITKLDQICIDTGMGLERVNAVLANTDDNYNAPPFRGILDQLADLTKTITCPDHKIIADHSRAIAFAIADGVLPDTSGRGYVVRKILRRALSRAANFFEVDESTDGLVKYSANYMIDEMGAIYPELIRYRGLINNVISSERAQLLEILRYNKKYIAKLVENCSHSVSGEILYKLHDTYGIPIEISVDAVQHMNLTPDLAAFQRILESNKQSQVSGKISIQLSVHDETSFHGYHKLEIDAKVLELGQVSGKSFVVLDKTVFYAEQGGQQGDKGVIHSQSWSLDVIDVQQIKGVVMHFGYINGDPQIGDQCHLRVDAKRRNQLMQHHSATHLLLAALRKYLGEHVIQKGSLVSTDYLRFDFLYNESIADYLPAIERQVNQWIQDNKEQKASLISKAEAEEKGAIATFGEKYGQIVRVVELGDSVELCCGTHVARTGDIGSFYIIKERSIAANVRRIEAVAGNAAYEYAKNRIMQVEQLSRLFTTYPDALVDVITKFKNTKPSHAHQAKEDASFAKEINGLNIAGLFYQEATQQFLLKASDYAVASSHVALIVNRGSSTTSLILRANQEANISAVEVLRDLIKECGGKGCGGRQDFAQGGFPSVKDNLELWDIFCSLYEKSYIK